MKTCFLYPGQGAQRLNMTYKLVERYDWAKELVKKAEKIFKSEGTEDIVKKIFRPIDRAIDHLQENEWKDELKQQSSL